MQIRKFEGRTMAEAIKHVKSELGSDAVILSTKNTNKGLSGSFGLFGAPMVEVTAALDRNPSVNVRAEGVSAKPLRPLPKEYTDGGISLNPHREDLGYLRDEIKDMKRLIVEMNKTKKSGGANKASLPGGLKVFYSGMIDSGVDVQLAKMVIEKCAQGPGRYGNKKNKGKISPAKEALAMTMMNLVEVSGGIKLNGRKGTAVAFVGPTGVGKTTTIAKLAAQYTKKGKNVSLITIDTYRVGAVEQFRTYAKILNVPVGVASTPRELREKIRFFKDKDLILIDTAGRSHKDHRQISFLKEFFPAAKGVPQIQLLLSATTKDSDIADIVKRFGKLPVKGHLITKLDECTSFGSLLNVVDRHKVPYSYFTTGQRVPEDIEIATPERVADLILRIRKEADSEASVLRRR